MTLSDWRDVATIVGALGTLTAVLFAVKAYVNNAGLERAKWLERLYQRFFESQDLKKVRDLIDCGSDKASFTKVKSLVEEEGTDFTDYLNFFEFVAILEQNRQLTIDEVRDLFCYYLGCLDSNGEISAYIRDPSKGFEKLSRLLDKMFHEAK